MFINIVEILDFHEIIKMVVCVSCLKYYAFFSVQFEMLLH